MQVSDIHLSDCFVSTSIPLDKAILCGIKCIAKEDISEEKTKVTFNRMNSEEIFSFFSEPEGKIRIGQWIKSPNLENVISEITEIRNQIEANAHTILVAESNIHNLLSDIRQKLMFTEQISENKTNTSS